MQEHGAVFDEFNRIDPEVLSVVAQQVQSVHDAMRQMKSTFSFEGSLIRFRMSCKINITMNPGYAGRSELPDNLKYQFRPVSMIQADFAMIAEIFLYSSGFLNSRVLAK